MTRREVQVEADLIGFSITCPTCPLLPHLEALGQKPRSCVAGLITNVQGAVPLNSCEFYTKDSISSEKPATLECARD